MNKFENLSETLGVDFDPEDYNEILKDENKTKKEIIPIVKEQTSLVVSEDENTAEKEDFQHSPKYILDCLRALKIV